MRVPAVVTIHPTRIQGCYLECFVNREVHRARAGLLCIAHIFTHFKTSITGSKLGVVQLEGMKTAEIKLGFDSSLWTFFKPLPWILAYNRHSLFYCARGRRASGSFLF